jgi:putative membrane protein
MNRNMAIALALGVSLITGLIVWSGAADVLRVFATIGWGVVIVSLFRLALLIFDTLSWRAVLDARTRPSLGRLFWVRWIADSINTLLPVARIGGEFVRARLLTRDGVSGAVSGASVMVDVTAGIATQFLFSVIGVFAFLMLARNEMNDLGSLAAGLALFGLGLFVFYKIQNAGPFLKLARWVESMAGDAKWLDVTGGAAALDAAVVDLYRRRAAFVLCCFWRITGWVAGAAEVWLIMYFLGYPISFMEAFILESLGQAARSAGFLVPGGLGVQEGGFILIGAQLGLTPELALALSLVKRVRELALGAPGLIAWQFTEGRGAWSGANNRKMER